MSLLTQASLITTPTAYKASKLYSIVPSSGNGDMTVVRNTTATRTNSSGLIESVGNNVPRLDYNVAGGCPSILLEPQRTNLLLNSVWAGGGSLPTSWLNSSSNTGTSTPIVSIKNPNVSAYRFVTTTQRQDIYQTFAVSLNSIFCLNVYVESVVGSIMVESIIRTSSSTAVGAVTFLKNNLTITNTTLVEAGNTYAVQFNCNVTAGTLSARVGLGCVGNVTGDITLSMPQFEQGATPTTPIAAYSTSFIPTTTTALTRNADVFSLTNVYTNNLITSAGGTWFIEIDNNLQYLRDTFGYALYINTSSNGGGNGLVIRNSNPTLVSRLSLGTVATGVITDRYLTLVNNIKVAIKWNGTTADFFVNGSKVLSNVAFTITAMEFLAANTTDVPKYIKSMILFPSPLTDAECTSLTTP